MLGHILQQCSKQELRGGKIYFNGIEKKSGNLGAEDSALRDDVIGARWEVYQTSQNREFNGSIDDVRISNIARSAAWIKFEYNNINEADNELTFAAQEAGDDVNPTVSTLSPLDGATSVGVTDNLVITFDEAVDVESGNITIYETSNNSVFETIDVTSGNVTGAGTTTITINPTSDLTEATDYYVQIDASSFDDTASNSYAGITNNTTWNFSSIITVDEGVFNITLSINGNAAAKPGDILRGVINFTNTKQTTITNTDITLELSQGIRYVEGSLSPSNNITISSVTQEGRNTLFRVASVARASTGTLSFSLVIGSNATPGEALTIKAYTEND